MKRKTQNKPQRNPHHIYITDKNWKILLSKARQVGLEGKGMASDFIEKVCEEDICFLDANLKKLFQHINVNLP